LELFPFAMSNAFIIATNSVTSADVAAARLGTRFGRMDLASQLSLLAVEPFAPHFDSFARDRIAIVLAARAGSLPTDVAYWNARNEPGGLSPTLFTYTLAERRHRRNRHPPSPHRAESLFRRATSQRRFDRSRRNLLQTNEADACVAIFTHVVSPALTR
jgi:hypothetical protein